MYVILRIAYNIYTLILLLLLYYNYNYYYCYTILLYYYIGDLEGAKTLIQSCISSLAKYFPHKNIAIHIETAIQTTNSNDATTNNSILPLSITNQSEPHDTLVNKYGTSHMKLIKYLTNLSDIARLQGEYIVAINYAIDAINIAYVSSMNLHSNLLPIDTTTTNIATTNNVTTTSTNTTTTTTTTNTTTTATTNTSTTPITATTTTNVPIPTTTSIQYIYDKTLINDLPKLLLAYNKPELSLLYAIYTLGLVYFDYQLYSKAALCFELCISCIDNIILLLRLNTILLSQRCKLWLAYTYAYLYKLEDSHKMVAKASKSISTLLGIL